LTTTFRAFAKPALVAVTETVTFSPWTNALEETVCCLKNTKKKMVNKRKKELSSSLVSSTKGSEKKEIRRLRRRRWRNSIAGKRRAHEWEITNTITKPYLMQQNVRVFRGKRREDRKGRHADAKE
jgi:hypothetical protein